MAKAGPFWTSGQGRRAGSSRLRLLIAFSSLAGQRVKQKRSGYQCLRRGCACVLPALRWAVPRIPQCQTPTASELLAIARGSYPGWGGDAPVLLALCCDFTVPSFC